MLKTVTEVCVVGPKQAYIDGDCRISHFLWQTVAYPGYGNPPPPLLKKRKKFLLTTDLNMWYFLCWSGF